MSPPGLRLPSRAWRAAAYHLFYSGGDWTARYAMGHAVSGSPLGPFSKSAANPILKGTGTGTGVWPGGGSVVIGPRTQTEQMSTGPPAANAGVERRFRGPIDRPMSSTSTVTQDARATVRRFIEALNARDADALRAIITDDARMRLLTGPEMHGESAARTLIAAAEVKDLRLVPLHGETVSEHRGVIHVRQPVRELIGPDDIERVAEFEIRDGRIAGFGLRVMD